MTDILKISIEWAKDEVFSSKFFILFGILFVCGAIGFWQMGKTETAKAFLYPLMICGILLLIVGIGLVYTNQSRIKSFENTGQENISTFLKSEISRAAKTVEEYELIVFKVIPLIIVCAALTIVFVPTPTWRAVGIATIGMLAIILIIDSNAYSRIKKYKIQLDQFEELKLEKQQNKV